MTSLLFLLIFSFLSISIYLNFLLINYLRKYYVALLQRRNLEKRARLLSMIGVKKEDHSKKLIIGFLHPYWYLNAGGGGERVLWTAVALHQRTQPETICAIYTGDLNVSKPEIIQKVKVRILRLALGSHSTPPPCSSSLSKLALSSRQPPGPVSPCSASLSEVSYWDTRHFLRSYLTSTLVYNLLLCSKLEYTMGYAFTYPVFRLLTHIPVGAYVHYPMISNDMLKRVSRRSSAHNNSSTISKSLVLSYAKLIYYILFAELYSLCLRQAHLIMVNSTWTKNHIDRLLKPWLHRDAIEEEEAPSMSTQDSSSNLISKPDGPLRLRLVHRDGRVESSKSKKGGLQKGKKYGKATVVYPPCDVQSFSEFPIGSREYTILSISQFRPEKDQATQIVAFAEFFRELKADDHPLRSELKLVLAGSCRDEADRLRVESLKELAAHLGVTEAVQFMVNVSWEELKQLLQHSLVGISTMVDEHFGISIVEFMAAGLIPLVHRSGGPLLDIVVPLLEEEGDKDGEERRTGFHAEGAASYAHQLAYIFRDLSVADRARIQLAARRQALLKFNTSLFENLWLRQFRLLLLLSPANRQSINLSPSDSSP
ncbi:hypothetical protein VP01_720g5 [Puccinia sorghi]|uniref:GDP-Man:Man(3)GlcNAc(2)-PP-Dol alpha-1,2-mannosyltransferase n=1 Tax=Puccinia sorghi TaxID=27349 RepID=A0A0L6UD79_9BASI|nr:hypothetical protein VP01_720g5 [Puccinia sorghi]